MTGEFLQDKTNGFFHSGQTVKLVVVSNQAANVPPEHLYRIEMRRVSRQIYLDESAEMLSLEFLDSLCFVRLEVVSDKRYRTIRPAGEYLLKMSDILLCSLSIFLTEDKIACAVLDRAEDLVTLVSSGRFHLNLVAGFTPGGTDRRVQVHLGLVFEQDKRIRRGIIKHGFYQPLFSE